MNKIIRQIPNTITCLNIISGCMAIVCAARASEPMWGLPGFQWAYIFIGVAAVADFCDGMAARLLHAYSELGKQLDSLCDCVSFGGAPAMLLYHTLSQAGVTGILPWCSFLIPVAGALRLARFNIDTRQTTSFIGLPIPANAIFWIGYTSMALSGTGVMLLPWILLPSLVLECWLMLSPLPILSLKFQNLRWKGNEPRWVLAAATVAAVDWMGLGGLMWLIVFYVILSLLHFNRTPRR